MVVPVCEVQQTKSSFLKNYNFAAKLKITQVYFKRTMRRKTSDAVCFKLNVTKTDSDVASYADDLRACLHGRRVPRLTGLPAEKV